MVDNPILEQPRDSHESDDNLQIDQTEDSEESEQDILTYEISYYPADLTLRVYQDRWEAGQLVIPDFQRNYVWDQVQASKLIESFLLGLPVPGVFLYKDRRSNKLSIIDGQQRILTAVRFFSGRFEDRLFRLKRVHPRWDGKLFDELSEADRLQIEDTVLRATVVQQLDPDDDSSIYHIFERLNTGGIKLSPMEIRKCVFYGSFMGLLEALNRDDNWRVIIGAEKQDKRLRDVEFLLRVLAMGYKWEQYEKPMKSFLNDFMAKNREGEAHSLDGISERFVKACDLVVQALGPTPFHLRGRLNLAVLDSVLSTVFRIGDAANLDDSFSTLKQDGDYIDAVTRNTSDTVVMW